MIDLIERGADEYGGVVRDDVVELPLGEFCGELRDSRLYFRCRRHGVGARLQIDADVDAWLAIHVDAEFIASLAGFGGGDVSQAHETLGGIALDDDFAEFFGREKLTGSRNLVVELLIRKRWRRADAADRALCVLRGNRVVNILRRDAKLGHAFRVKPDAHGGLNVAEDIHVADPRQALEFIDDIEGCIVRHFRRRHRLVGRIERHHEELVVGAFSH